MRWAAAAMLGLLAAIVSGEDAVEGRIKWEQARLALEKKDARAALARFEEALRSLPTDPLLLYEAARCAFDLKELDKAETWIEKAVRTEDKAFQQRPEHEQAVKLAAKVRDARNETRRAGSRESAQEKAFEVVQAGLVAVLGKRAPLFEKYYHEVDADEKGVKHYEMREEWSSPPHCVGYGQTRPSERFSPKGSAMSEVSFCEIETEKAAEAITSRVMEMATKQLPSWRKDAAKKVPRSSTRPRAHGATGWKASCGAAAAATRFDT